MNNQKSVQGSKAKHAEDEKDSEFKWRDFLMIGMNLPYHSRNKKKTSHAH